MRKILLLCFIMVLSACGMTAPEKASVYEQMVQQIHEEKNYISKSEYFDCTLTVRKYASGGYQYDVVINHPKIDMENVKAIAICETEQSDLFPSLGLEEGDICHLFVNQIDKENNYYEGIRLSGISSQDHPQVKLYVAFTANQQIYEQYLLLEGSEENDAVG